MRYAPLLVLLAFAAAGCSRRQSAVTVPARIPAPPPKPALAPKRRTPQTPPAEKARTPQEVPPSTIPPTLEALTTPQERATHLRQIESSIQTAEQNVATFHSRRSSARTAEDVARVQSLIRQARAAQSANDLPSARIFARRAEILSADLLSR